MPKKATSQQQLLAENAALRARLEQTEQTLSELFSGEADALMIPAVNGTQLFTLQGIDQAYRLLIEEMSEGALTLTAEGVTLYANRRFAEMLKAPLEKVIGSAIHSWVAPEDQDTLQQLLRHDEAQIHRRGEVMLLASDGARLPGYLSINLSPMKEGPQEFCMLATDLTEQKRLDAIITAEKSARETLAVANQSRRVLLSVIEDQKMAEEALRKSEEKFRQLFEGSRDALLIVTPPSWKFTAANQAALQLFGAESAVQFSALGLLDVSPERQPDGRLSADKAPVIFATVMKEGSSFFEWMHRRIDGTSFPADVLLTRIDAGGEPFIQATVRDISERNRVEEALKKSEEKYRGLFENAQIGIFTTRTSDGKLVLANDAMAKMFGYDNSDEATADYIASEHYVNPEQREKLIDTLRKHGRFDNFEAYLTRNDGVARWFLYSGKFVQNKNLIEGVAVDITERKQAEEQLVLFRTLLDHSSDAIEVLEPSTMRFLDVNETECQELGYSREELLSKNLYDIDPEFTPEMAQATEEKIRQEGSLGFEGLHRRKNGSTFPVEVSATLVELDSPYILSIVRDITERKRAESALKESEEKFRAIFDHASDGIIVMDIDEHTVKFANKGMEQMLGYGPGELVGLSFPQLHPPEARPQAAALLDSGTRSGQSNEQDVPLQTKEGRVLYADLSGSPVDIGGRHYLLGMFRDATQRRTVERSLRLANRALKTLSAGNLALVRATSEDELLQTITRVIVEHGGYALAVVDYAEDDAEKSITPKAWSGYEDECYWAEHLSWADTEQGQLPVARAIRRGETQICHDIVGDPSFTPWRDYVEERGYLANIALPLSDGSHTFGGLCIYSSDTNTFDEVEVQLLEEQANDLAYGIVTLRTRKEHEQHAVILRQGLEQSIQTIAATVEARDPYTAGHQRRVAQLATAIAREMGLSEDETQGLHLAAIIHDLGKIRVPAEILSKPGKITNAEFGVIKDHPQAAYDILKDVKFPWPIAEIIWQHHERLDGKGYPQGLKGEQILPEARILTVADVMEAMSSHRPYRASLGIETALEELRHGRGIAYDSAVVDVCLKLFTEKGFVFSNQAP